MSFNETQLEGRRRSAVPMERTMRFFMNGLILSAMIFVLNTSTASALDLDSNIVGIFTDSSFMTSVPNLVIDADGNATADLAPGDVVLLGIDVSNPIAEVISAIFATTTIEGSQFSGTLGAQLPPTMLKATGFGATSLANVNTGATKGNSPNLNYGAPGDLWIQSVSYALQAGAEGTGPDQIQIALVLGASIGIGDFVNFALGETAGDAIAGAGGLPLSGPVTFEGATINVPEPGTALLMGLGLAGLAGAGRRRS
jgi:hypothetical protein